MHLGGLVEEGKYYAVVTQLDCSGSATAQIGVTMGATAVNLGLGDVVGLVYDTGSPGTIPSSGTVMLDFWDGNFAGYGMTLGISDL